MLHLEKKTFKRNDLSSPHESESIIHSSSNKIDRVVFKKELMASLMSGSAQSSASFVTQISFAKKISHPPPPPPARLISLSAAMTNCRAM